MKFRNHIASFKSKLFKPCKQILQLFKFRLRKPVLIKSLQFHHRRKPKTSTVMSNTTHEGRRGLSKITSSVLRSLRGKRDDQMDQLTELTSFSDHGAVHHKAPYPSPITPAYIRIMSSTTARPNKMEAAVSDDACRSFEDYLIGMIVEQGKMRDLVDVEELLYCWKNLKSPVFIDLVCRFYGELCKDLFSANSYI
ncbi:hypothetical protein DH2020_000709 [Rehmannia glutinosa]|uniref:OVATE domain-containing protein n=1 Tax=Rehmannia glutinosa TaxID=99300 RepID=A0ABR0XXQ4_REHGL